MTVVYESDGTASIAPEPAGRGSSAEWKGYFCIRCETFHPAFVECPALSFPIPGPPSSVRTFETGATRSDDTLRDDPEGYLSPLVIDRYCAYMTVHRVQPDGNVRASDNWQLGMTKDSYIKGLFRHFLHLWTRHRSYPVRDPKAAADIEEDLCAILFNASGYLHELLKAKVHAASANPPTP